MKRSTWSAVLVTALVLAAAGTLPRLAGGAAPLSRAAGVWATRAAQAAEAHVVVTALVLGARFADARVAPAAGRVSWSAPRVAWLPAAGVAGAAGALLLAGLARGRTRATCRRRPGHRVRRALVMAREGRDAAAIAGELGLARDAVRALLRPAVPARGRVGGRQAACGRAFASAGAAGVAAPRGRATRSAGANPRTSG